MHWEQHLDKVGVIKDIWCNRIFIFINTHRQSLPIYQHQNMRKFCLFIWGHCLCVLTCTCISLLRWFSMSPNLLLHLFVYIWLESALHSIFQLWMSRNQAQGLCSFLLNFDILSKSIEICLNHITVNHLLTKKVHCLNCQFWIMDFKSAPTLTLKKKIKYLHNWGRDV